jgi:hypothetical protein
MEVSSAAVLSASGASNLQVTADREPFGVISSAVLKSALD